jgi:hypothetical protein
MDDFSRLSNTLLNEYQNRSVPFSLRDYVRMCLESLAVLIAEDRPAQFQSAVGRFFATLYGGNRLFNDLPLPSRNNLNSVVIGVPSRRLFELLNDFGRVIDELSLLNMSSTTLRDSLHENGFPYRPNEIFSLLEQVDRIDWNIIEVSEHNVSNDSAPVESRPDDAVKSDTVFTAMNGVSVLFGELTEETRTSKEWALICGFSETTFHNRTGKKNRKTKTMRIVSFGEHYRIQVDDLRGHFVDMNSADFPVSLAHSRRDREDFLSKRKAATHV